VKRLADIISKGFWMTKPPEKIHGANGSHVEYHSPMTCFTEVRLSDTELHTQRYGLLGIAVNRHFVLERFGGPVHYVRNHCTESTIGNVQAILDPIKALPDPNLATLFCRELGVPEGDVRQEHGQLHLLKRARVAHHPHIPPTRTEEYS